jgi:hypothetical protein
MRITRTYPQPDSPEPHIGPRERALAVFKYLLDLEPEAAKDHPMFACIVHAFQQAEQRGWICGEYGEASGGHWPEDATTYFRPSLVPLISTMRTLPARPEPVDEGKL